MWNIHFRLPRFAMSFQARHNFGIVEIDGMLYILGGEDGDRELISMECYDIYSKTWTKQPDLTMVRKVSASVCCCWLLHKLASESVFSGVGCCHGKAHPQGLTQYSSAEQSPRHTPSFLKCAFGTTENAQGIQDLEFCLCWQLAFMSVVTYHSRKKPVREFVWL